MRLYRPKDQAYFDRKWILLDFEKGEQKVREVVDEEPG
jgi:hypothetical protein